MKKSVFKNIVIRILIICMFIASLGISDVQTVKAEEPTTMYFLNSQNWSQVGAYVYGDKGELLGAWPGVDAVEAEELGTGWVKVELSDTPSFNIIFFNKENEAERAELLIPDAAHAYVSATGVSYASVKEAEEALAATPTVLYFVTNDKWEEVYAYADKDGSDVGAAWPGMKAEPAEEGMGEGWWKVEVPQNALLDSFDVVFHNKMEHSLIPLLLTIIRAII